MVALSFTGFNFEILEHPDLAPIMHPREEEKFRAMWADHKVPRGLCYIRKGTAAVGVCDHMEDNAWMNYFEKSRYT